MKRVLMIAFHYPPAAGTSGVQRALRFSIHLKEFGWEPIVLSAHPRAYEHRDSALCAEIPGDVTVIRAQAWDTKRHLSLRGKYSKHMALPDRWCSWVLGGVAAGLRACRRYSPAAIWSTYPIATAHWIGVGLNRLTGIPLVADFRDPMAQDGYPEDPMVWRSYWRIENRVIRQAARCTFTTPSAVAMYKKRYSENAHKIELLENGYDAAVFENLPPPLEPLNSGKRTLLHSGIVYPNERDPSALMASLGKLKSVDRSAFDRLVVRFRAPIHDQVVLDRADKYGVLDAIEVLPRVSYEAAIDEMRRADGLLVLQASNCNAQVPAKFYEYLRAGPPIVLVTDEAGDTATVARRSGIRELGQWNDTDAILAILQRFASGDCSKMLPLETEVSKATRRQRTSQLADLLACAAASVA